MSTTGFCFARDVRRQHRYEAIRALAVVGLSAVGAWNAAIVVHFFPVPEAPTHPGETAG